MALGDRTKCKPCFGGPRMIHAHWKILFQDRGLPFFTHISSLQPAFWRGSYYEIARFVFKDFCLGPRGPSQQKFLLLQGHWICSLEYSVFSSVRSTSGYHGLLGTYPATTFPNFSNSSDSKVKVKVKGPNMCYIFEKHGIQGYQIWHSRVLNVKYTNTRLHKNANTKIQSA